VGVSGGTSAGGGTVKKNKNLNGIPGRESTKKKNNVSQPSEKGTLGKGKKKGSSIDHAVKKWKTVAVGEDHTKFTMLVLNAGPGRKGVMGEEKGNREKKNQMAFSTDVSLTMRRNRLVEKRKGGGHLRGEKKHRSYRTQKKGGVQGLRT